jgi:hypothetical protein
MGQGKHLGALPVDAAREVDGRTLYACTLASKANTRSIGRSIGSYQHTEIKVLDVGMNAARYETAVRY